MANSKSVSSGGNAESDVTSVGSNINMLSVQVRAKNDGTPASGDELTVYLLGTLGDPDADPDSADSYETEDNAPPFVLDTNSKDPSEVILEANPAWTSYKVRAENGASSNAITVSHQHREHDKDGAWTAVQGTWT